MHCLFETFCFFVMELRACPLVGFIVPHLLAFYWSAAVGFLPCGYPSPEHGRISRILSLLIFIGATFFFGFKHSECVLFSWLSCVLLPILFLSLSLLCFPPHSCSCTACLKTLTKPIALLQVRPIGFANDGFLRVTPFVVFTRWSWSLYLHCL